MPRAVVWIWRLCAIHYALGAVTYLHFLATGSYRYLNWFFLIPGTLFFLLAAAAEFYFAFECRAGFDSGEPMRLAWTFIALASMARFAAAVMISLDHWRLVPISGNGASVLGLALPKTFAQIGEVIGGPVAMVLLAAALGRVLSIQRQFGILRGLTRTDVLLIVLIVVVTIGEVSRIMRYLRPPYPHPSLAQTILWTSDPLLGLLLVQAVLIRRSASRVGLGLVSQCWGMYVIAILITLVGDASIWVVGESMLPERLVALTWYIWFFAAAAYATAPAYQLAAMKLPIAGKDVLRNRL